MKKIINGWAAICLFACAFGANADPKYDFSDVKIFDAYSWASSINNSNQVTGVQQIPIPFETGGVSMEQRAVIWDKSSINFAPITYEKNSYTQGLKINDSGDVLLQRYIPYKYDNENGVWLTDGIFGYNSGVWSSNDNTVTFLNLPGHLGGIYNQELGFSLNGRDLNNSGNVISQIQVPTHVSNSSTYVWQNADAVPINISNPDDYFSAAAINNAGAMAGGAYFNGSADQHAAVKNGDSLIDLGTIGGHNSFATDISDNGYVLGMSEINMNSGIYRTVFWKDGDAHLLQYVPGAVGKIDAVSINDHGQSVGSVIFDTPHGQIGHAIFWNGTKSTDLNDYLSDDLKNDGWVLTQAIDINDNGSIVGTAVNTNNTDIRHAFLLASNHPIPPIPEPSIYIMLLAGLIVLGFVSKKKITG